MVRVDVAVLILQKETSLLAANLISRSFFLMVLFKSLK